MARGTIDKGADPLVCSPADSKRSAALVSLHRKLSNNREIDSEVEFIVCTKISELLSLYFYKVISHQTKL